jgi:putative addiction module component (TIGR02574 family)
MVGGKVMHGMKEIIQEVESLPVEERAMVVDLLLRSLNPPDVEIDKEWLKVAKRRVAELRSGSVNPVAGNEVFSKIRERFGR